MHALRPCLALLLVLLLGGCSLFGIEEPEPTEIELWDEARKALSEDNWEIAIDKLEQLESRFPFGRFSAQAQMELIYSYYRTGRGEETRSAADRFIRLHPQHDNIDYAYYLKGLSNFDEDADVIGRYVPTDSSQRDPGAARDSFKDFATLLNRYPQSQYAPDARLRMLYLRNQLAAYEIHVARYYITRGAFIAAANRGRYVVENFQKTPSVADGLAVMVHAYTELGMNELASDAQRVLERNFPDYQPPQQERSLFDIMTFDLFSQQQSMPMLHPGDKQAPRPAYSAVAEGERFRLINTDSQREMAAQDQTTRQHNGS
ncbi:outer membrane protein assembly factor BamD [Motiliproteus sediminis]|uniref:outer membrane protein assembly factor BamD n=1 Tax=Motiliproteus sediminis TaxID=1468178 RepID=UPI001AEF89BC|nr:outer membrane protein assembly factor BamD [Motiliproteus sediminis]